LKALEKEMVVAKNLEFERAAEARPAVQTATGCSASR
jgi:hypothetical protein